jgi:hypothetical protein
MVMAAVPMARVVMAGVIVVMPMRGWLSVLARMQSRWAGGGHRMRRLRQRIGII